MSKWIRKGDKVVVLSGNEKGRVGTVLRRKADRAVVQGMNIRKRHAKRRSQVQTPTILEIEVPIHISNLALCDEEGKPVNVKVRTTEKSKELYYLEGKKEITLRTLKNNR